ncbi:membrane-associated protein, putative, partial [Bodo saltans]
MSVIICRTSERNQRDANRHVNNISTARLISNNSRKWFLARLITCAVIIICAAPQAVHSLDASDVVTVPCGAETIYGPAVAHNTTFVLRDCYNTTTASVTGLTIHLNGSSGALTKLSIVVENSNQVYVIVHSLSTTSLPSGQIVSLNANISNMNVTFRNVTNDINFTGNSMFRVDLFSVVSNLRIKIGDVRHSRDTNIIKLNWVDSLSRILVLVTNVSLTGNGSLITFDTIVDALRDSTVSMVNVTSSSPLVIIQRAFDVTLPVYTIFAERIQIYLVSCIMSGTARSGDGYLPFLVHFRNTHIDARSNITIADFQMRITSASLAGALLVQNADLGNVYVSIVNFTCIVPSGIAYAVLIQNSTVNWAAIAIDSALISGVNASRLSGFLVVSSAVANSHLFATNVSLSTSQITTRMYLMSLEYSATVGPKPSLSNTSITISNCNLDGVFSMVVYVVSASISATDISILNVAMAAASQYLPIILFSPPGTTDGLTLSVLDSYVVGAYPLRLEALTAVNSNIVVAASTLVITQGGNFPGSPLFALTISTAVLTNTTVSVTATDVVGAPLGVNAGWIVSIQSCTFSGVNASLSFASLTKSGGILYVSNSIFDSMSTVTAAVANNITIPSTLSNQLFCVISTIITRNSTLKMLLPLLVSMDAASSTSDISAMYIGGSTVSQFSGLQVSGVGPASYLQWPNSTLWLDSCN